MSIEIPEDRLQAAIASGDGQRLLEETLCALWSKGEIGGGKAAKLLGISRIEFWDLAGSRGYTWPYTVEDLNREMETLKELGRL